MPKVAFFSLVKAITLYFFSYFLAIKIYNAFHDHIPLSKDLSCVLMGSSLFAGFSYQKEFFKGPLMASCFEALAQLFIALPLVFFLRFFIHQSLLLFFSQDAFPEQIAVTLAKRNFADYFFAALFLLSVAVPICEEILFRGYLQNYLKNHFSINTRVLFASIIFSAAHLNSAQKLQNVELFFSLCCFSCFLGYSYEKNRNLYTSIFLHSFFNAFSLSILYFHAASA